MKMFSRVPLGALMIGLATPALADHMGPSGFGSGGGMAVFDPGTLDAGHWSAGLRLSLTRPEQRPDAELEALAEAGIGAHNTNYNLNASAGLAYGLNHHLTLSAELPYVRRDQLREGAPGGVERLGSVSGIGDLNLLAKYRLTDGAGPGFALIGGIKLPTGSTHRRSPDGERLETEHQPGSGSWDPIVGASGSLPLGHVQLTASALYQWSTRGAQATKLGDRLQGGIALSHRFGARPTEHINGHNHHHGDELDERRGPARIELGRVRRARRRMGGPAADRRRNRAGERRQMGVGGAWHSIQCGERLVGGGRPGASRVAAHPRIAPQQPLPSDADARPRALVHLR